MYARVYRRDPSDVYKSLKFTRERKKRKSEIKKKKSKYYVFSILSELFTLSSRITRKEKKTRKKKRHVRIKKKKRRTRTLCIQRKRAFIHAVCAIGFYYWRAVYGFRRTVVVVVVVNIRVCFLWFYRVHIAHKIYTENILLLLFSTPSL